MTVEADKLRGAWTDPEAGRVSFAEWNVPVQTGRMVDYRGYGANPDHPSEGGLAVDVRGALR